MVRIMHRKYVFSIIIVVLLIISLYIILVNLNNTNNSKQENNDGTISNGTSNNSFSIPPVLQRFLDKSRNYFLTPMNRTVVKKGDNFSLGSDFAIRNYNDLVRRVCNVLYMLGFKNDTYKLGKDAEYIYYNKYGYGTWNIDIFFNNISYNIYISVESFTGTVIAFNGINAIVVNPKYYRSDFKPPSEKDALKYYLSILLGHRFNETYGSLRLHKVKEYMSWTNGEPQEIREYMFNQYYQGHRVFGCIEPYCSITYRYETAAVLELDNRNKFVRFDIATLPIGLCGYKSMKPMSQEEVMEVVTNYVVNQTGLNRSLISVSGSVEDVIFLYSFDDIVEAYLVEAMIIVNYNDVPVTINLNFIVCNGTVLLYYKPPL